MQMSTVYNSNDCHPWGDKSKEEFVVCSFASVFRVTQQKGSVIMRPQSGEGGRGSLIDFALILILFSIVLVVILVLLGPAITDFLGRLVSR